MFVQGVPAAAQEVEEWGEKEAQTAAEMKALDVEIEKKRKKVF